MHFYCKLFFDTFVGWLKKLFGNFILKLNKTLIIKILFFDILFNLILGWTICLLLAKARSYGGLSTSYVGSEGKNANNSLDVMLLQSKMDLIWKTISLEKLMALPLLLAAVRELLKCTVEPFQHRIDARGAALQHLKPLPPIRVPRSAN